MSKAILVIDMPDKCSECKLQIGGEFSDIRCVATNKVIPIRCDKPEWCPLQEVPEGVKKVGFTRITCNGYEKAYLNLE